MRKLVLLWFLLLQWVSVGLAGMVTLEWDPSPDPDVIGYNLYYGSASQDYINFVASGLSTKATIENLVDGVSYYFAVTSINSAGLESDYSGEVMYLVPSVPGVIQLSGLNQVYDGLSKPVTISTSPPGLAVAVTYNGTLDPPVHAGSYDVTAQVVDLNYSGSVTVVLIIGKADRPIALTGLNQVYDGAPKPVAVSTGPVNAPVLITYAGLSDPPTGAGTYLVDCRIVAATDYTGHNSGLLIVSKATAGIQLSNLTQLYTGNPRQVSFTTAPPMLNAIVTYQDSPEAPSDPGDYTVIATIDDPNYQGSTTNLLSLLPGNSLRRTPSKPNLPEVSPAPILTDSPAKVVVLSWVAGAFPVTIWHSTNLSLWTPFAGEFGTSNFLVISNSAPKLFFRATRATPDAVIPEPLLLQNP
jgi:hypothetical protein